MREMQILKKPSVNDGTGTGILNGAVSGSEEGSVSPTSCGSPTLQNGHSEGSDKTGEGGSGPGSSGSSHPAFRGLGRMQNSFSGQGKLSFSLQD